MEQVKLFTEDFIMRNPAGMHMRPSVQMQKSLINLGMSSGDVILTHNNETIDALDSIGIYSLGIHCGNAFTVDIHQDIEADVRVKIREVILKACQPIEEIHHKFWRKST